MTDDQYRVLVNYVRNCADKMGLRDWQFDLVREAVEDGVIARVEVWGSSRMFSLKFGEAFWRYGPIMQRETVVHELVHCHTHELIRLVNTALRNELGRIVWYALDQNVEQLHELCVDGIAAAWARMMPLIDWQDQEPIYWGYEEQSAKVEAPAARDEAIIDT